jgi:glutathione S-transferase
MRVRQRKASGPVSVPALFAGKERLRDSWSIARYAEGVGNGAPLFAVGDAPAIKELDDLSELGLRAGRALALDRVLQSSGALTEMLPRHMRGTLGPVGRAIAAFGIRRTLRKYGADSVALPEHEAQLVTVLDDVRARLGKSASGGPEPRYLRGKFTYADIAIAQVFLFVAPVAETYRSVRIAKASRACFEYPKLAGAYRDLLGWRDALYARHRGGR